MEVIIQTLSYRVFEEAKKINQLFELGLSELNIRKPNYSKAEYIEILDNVNEKYHNRIIIHSHFELLKKYNLKGIHVPYKNLNSFIKKYRYKSLKKKFGISISTTIKDFKNNFKSYDFIDFLVVGPIFKKFSEKSIVQKVNLFEVKKDIDKLDLKVLAFGCFSISNINKVEASGFKGVVLQSYIWKSPDINKTYNSLIISLDKSDNEMDTIAV